MIGIASFPKLEKMFLPKEILKKVSVEYQGVNMLDRPHRKATLMFNGRRNGRDPLQQFELLLDVVDIVSFDLFDTLIQREDLFSPKDLFYRVQDEAERRLGLRIDNFTQIRIRAEEIARVRAWGRQVEEVTFDEIYTELGRIANLENDTLQCLKEIELECERSALIILERGKGLFEAALAAGKTVIIISDTYFSKDFITEIINQKGYGDVRKIYASSTYGRTKAEGSLYRIVLQELQCKPNRLLHVGDNQYSDVSMALSQGCRAFFLLTTKQQLKWLHGLGDQPSGNLIMSAMLCNLNGRSEPKAKSQDPQFVMAQTSLHNLSLLYFGYAAWLVEQFQREGYQRVYFAARDGLIMKRFFDLTAAAAGFKIDSRYLYISRAVLYPSLIFTDPKMARQLLGQNWDHLTIEYALGRISLTFEECVDLLSKHKLANRKLMLDNSALARFSNFLDNVWSRLERRYEEHYQLTIDYLRQEMMLTEEKAALVDIGWHGTLQYSLLKLFKYLGIIKELKGYYLGTFAKPVDVETDFKAIGFLMQNDEPRWISNLVRSGPSVLELFHSAGHGSVLGYRRHGRSVIPVLEDNFEERKQFQQIIEPMQNHAFNFVEKQLERLAGVPIKAPDPGLIARIGLRVIYDPTPVEAATFGRLKIASDFGGRMKSVTGMLEWDLEKIKGEVLPDGIPPLWRPGFQVLKNL